MYLRTLQVVAIALVGLCLMPLGAHLFEMPGKYRLGEDDYFVVQGIYNGWAWFGVAQVAAVVALGWLGAFVRSPWPSASQQPAED